MLRLHYVYGSPKRSTPWEYGHFCLLARVCFLMIFQGMHDRPLMETGADPALRLGSQCAMVNCTFPPDLPHSGGSSHVSLHSDQLLPCLSSSVKAFYSETWMTGGV